MRFDRRWGLVALVCAAATAWGVAGAFAATPSQGTVSVGSPATWRFGPAGGPSGSTDSYKLTVHLPKSASVLYHPNVRTGTDYAAVRRSGSPGRGAHRTTRSASR